jgi:hypothetical protein
VHSVTPPHLTLAASSVASMGDPNKVFPSSSQTAMLHQEALVLGESLEEMPEVESAHGVPMMQAWNGGGAPLFQCASAQVEAVAGDTWLGADGVEAGGMEPRPDDASGAPCFDLVMRGSSTSMPGRVAPSDAVPVPGCCGSESSRTGVAGFPLLATPTC